MANYAMQTSVKGSLEGVRSKVAAALKAQGFGILTEIDVRKTLKEKIGAELDPAAMFDVVDAQTRAKLAALPAEVKGLLEAALASLT